jgi:hypothetical protein
MSNRLDNTFLNLTTAQLFVSLISLQESSCPSWPDKDFVNGVIGCFKINKLYVLIPYSEGFFFQYLSRVKNWSLVHLPAMSPH